MVKGDIIVTEQKEYKTDCEIVWVKIEIVGTRPFFIAAYYGNKTVHRQDNSPTRSF